MRELPELGLETEWLESEFPSLLASVSGVRFLIPDDACAEWLGRVVDWPLERGESM